MVVPPPYDVVAEPTDVLDHLSAAVPDDEPVALVAHSNAGLYAAALAARHDVRGLVFADAGVPSDTLSTPTAPAAFRRHLAELADDVGQLPVWSRWWPAEDVALLFPDAETEDAVLREQRRLPLAYFEADIPSPPGWQRLPAAYLAFGDTYAEELARAHERGWPTATLPGRHLHLLIDPPDVTAALLGLLVRMGLEASA